MTGIAFAFVLVVALTFWGVSLVLLLGTLIGVVVNGLLLGDGAYLATCISRSPR